MSWGLQGQRTAGGRGLAGGVYGRQHVKGPAAAVSTARDDEVEDGIPFVAGVVYLGFAARIACRHVADADSGGSAVGAVRTRRARCAGSAVGTGRSCRAVYLCTTLDFPLC